MRSAGVASFVVVLGVVLSCGGRMVESYGHPEGAAGSGATGGSDAGRGARDGRGGGGDAPPRSAGGSTAVGTAGKGAASAVGGGNGCGPCPTIGCLDGYTPAPPEPGGCCSSGCVLDCRNVACSDIDLDCKAGFHVGTLAGECCPQCMPEAPLPCEQAMAEYELVRQRFIDKHQALGCLEPGECVTFAEHNRCRATCGTPIHRAARDAIEEELYNFAADNCTQCQRPGLDLCPEPPRLHCAASASCEFLGIGAK